MRQECRSLPTPDKRQRHKGEARSRYKLLILRVHVAKEHTIEYEYVIATVVKLDIQAQLPK